MQPALSTFSVSENEIARRAILRAKIVDENVGYRNYTPRGAAAELRECQNSEVLLSGPAGTGKTRGVLEWLHHLCLTYAGVRVLIVRKTRASLSESALYTFEEFVLPPDSPMRDGPRRQFRQSYTYDNGSRIVVGGLDKSTRLYSTEFDIVYVPEAVELELQEWESLKRSLRHHVLPWQQLIGDTNPDKPEHWIKLRCDSGPTKMLHSKHEDNPVLWNDEKGEWTPEGLAYLAALDELTGALYQRLRLGLWAQAEGAVYETWDDAIHLVDAFPIPKDWRRIRSIDFGFTNPFVCQWWAIDPDGRMYLYREIYITQRLVEDLADDIKSASDDERIEATTADHDAEDRETLARHGVKTVIAKKEISVGIQAVQARLRVVGDKPRLMIMRGARSDVDKKLESKKKPTSTYSEIGGYVWPKGSDGKPVKEVPLDINNHGMDAMRYAVMHIDGPREAKTMRPRPNPFYGGQ